MAEYEQREISDTIFLDTTYLLPLFGIEVELSGYDVNRLTAMFRKFAVMYSPISLIESKWIILHYAKKQPKNVERLLQAYTTGVATLFDLKDRLKELASFTMPEIERIADQLLLKYHVTDYFDRMIYATASHYSYVLLTEDEELRNLQKLKSEIVLNSKPKKVISWSNISRGEI